MIYRPCPVFGVNIMVWFIRAGRSPGQVGPTKLGFKRFRVRVLGLGFSFKGLVLGCRVYFRFRVSAPI